ncbi:hypothetical protein C8R44DRAFT_864788 [Mycena epipterygia]|nr:hypothetical protein C8R44DRAFT_864788 [Mycena epipterygia]
MDTEFTISSDILMGDVPYNVSVDPIPYNVLIDHQNHISQYSDACQYLNWILPSYYFHLAQSNQNNLENNAEQLAQPEFVSLSTSELQASVYPQIVDSRPSIFELLGNQAPAKCPAPYIIPPANLSAEELLAEWQRVSNLEGHVPQPRAGERRPLPVSPHFTRPALFGIRLNTARRRRNGGHGRFRSGGRLIQSKFLQRISSQEQNNVKQLKRESDALQKWIDAKSFSDEDRTPAERRRSTIWSRYGYSSRSNSHFSSSSSTRSAGSSSRRGSEPWASNTGTGEPDPNVDDAASETSESSLSSQGSSWESDSNSNHSSYGRRLSPPPRRGDRLVRMQQHQLSLETRSLGFLHTVMNAVANLWPFA